MSAPAKSTSEAFFSGCRNGLELAVFGILPRIMLAFVMIYLLEGSGALEILRSLCAPLMGLWGLPGEAALVLATAFVSNAAAVGMIVSMLTAGTLSAADATVLLPGLYLSGALLQFAARVLHTAGVSKRHWPAMFIICFVNSAAAMLLVSAIVR